MELSAEDEKTLAGFGFLTRKPMLVVLQPGRRPDPARQWMPQASNAAWWPCRASWKWRSPSCRRKMPRSLWREYGIEELGLNRVIRLSYDLLGLQSFFTVGEDEVRAWTVRRGASAHEACGGDPHRPAKRLHPRRGGDL